jgi:hypothetical protein
MLKDLAEDDGVVLTDKTLKEVAVRLVKITDSRCCLCLPN